MTTGLIRGMTLEQAGEAVMRKAVELREASGSELGLWTESGRESVLVGISRRGKAAATMLIPKEEYCGLKLLELMGISLEPAAPAAPTAQEVLARTPKLRRKR